VRSQDRDRIEEIVERGHASDPSRKRWGESDLGRRQPPLREKLTKAFDRDLSNVRVAGIVERES